MEGGEGGPLGSGGLGSGGLGSGSGSGVPVAEGDGIAAWDGSGDSEVTIGTGGLVVVGCSIVSGDGNADGSAASVDAGANAEKR